MPGRRWMILAVLFAARAATGFQFQSIGSTANLLMQDLGINYSEIGMLLGAYLLPGIVVAFPAGLLGQRFREKKLGLAGLAMMAISGAALSWSDGFLAALVARTIGGVGATIVVLVATKMTVDWFDRSEIVLAMSLLQMSWPFGAMLALPIQASIAQRLGWPAVMLSSAVCASLRALCFHVCFGARAADAAGGDRPRRASRCRSASGHDRRPDLGRDEPRLHFVLQLCALADRGAGIDAHGCGLPDQPRDLVHDPGHSIRRISRASLGQADRGDHLLRAGRRRGAGAVRRRRLSDYLLPVVRGCGRSAVGSHPVATVEGAWSAPAGGRAWRVLHVLLRADGRRASGRRPFAGRLGIALGRTDRGCGIAWRDSALVSCLRSVVEAASSRRT